MPQDNQPYAASCNPARRAKQPPIATAVAMSSSKPIPSQRTIIPSPSSSSEGSDFDPSPAPVPAKRGRKPGPLSRAARETQRKLNHSIIEKARRTKINEALASLRQLVPSDYGYTPAQPEDDDEGVNDGNGKKKDAKKGKREEKEKEFKLEILVRTVSFLQDLLGRVQVLESQAGPRNSGACSKCCLPSPSSNPTSPLSNRDVDKIPTDASKKRKRPVESLADGVDHPIAKRIAPEPKSQSLPAASTSESHSQPTSPASLSPYPRGRLPSISSWLPHPDAHIDPQLLDSPSQLGISGFGLPSPPSSTQFAPQSHPHLASVVPTLHLGASSLPPSAPSSNTKSANATAYNHKQPISSPGSTYRTPLLSPRRSPEDESAASLLLQISGVSPILGAIRAPVAYDMSTMRTACVTPVAGGAREGLQAQTPGSMLGLVGRKE